MLGEDMAVLMAAIAVTRVGMLSNMRPPAILRADTLVYVLAEDVVTILRGPHAAKPALQDEQEIGMAVVTGEAIMDTGEVIMDILGSAITAWVMDIRTTAMAITATAPVGAMIPITVIIPADIIPTDTGIGRI
jgi:hypothetical protein